MPVCMPTCMHPCLHMYCQVDTLDEASVASKVGTYNVHQSTLDFTLENFEASLTKYKAMLVDEAA